MAFNGSGTFTRLYSWASDATNGILVRSDRMDGEDNNFASGLSTVICKDGQTTTTAMIPFAVGLKVNDGTVGTPSITVTSELTSGLYKPAAGQLAVSSLGINTAQFSSANFTAGSHYSYAGGTPVLSAGTANNYYQLSLQNKSNGASASTDLVCTADTGNDTTHYVNVGINGSAYSSTGPFSTALDGYVYSQDSNLVIGTVASKDIIFATNNTEVARVTAAGALTIGGAAAITAASTSVFTNKTLDTAATGNVLKINGATVTEQDNSCQDFRLTLISGNPVTTADITGATTIYCTPYRGNRISLYDGTYWNVRKSAEFSIALGTLTSSKPYDVFCYDNAGVPTLEFLAWTNDVTRATALAYQDGVLVKFGAPTRRYLGSFYTTATTTTEDSAVNRYLYNYYNRMRRPMSRVESTASWTYTTSTIRQANGNTANQLNYIQGVSEDCVTFDLSANMTNTSAGNENFVSIGIDSTTTEPSSGYTRDQAYVPVNNYRMALRSRYMGNPGVGRHFASWNEYGQGSGTTTWLGNLSGISGSIFA